MRELFAQKRTTKPKVRIGDRIRVWTGKGWRDSVVTGLNDNLVMVKSLSYRRGNTPYYWNRNLVFKEDSDFWKRDPAFEERERAKRREHDREKSEAKKKEREEQRRKLVQQRIEDEASIKRSNEAMRLVEKMTENEARREISRLRSLLDIDDEDPNITKTLSGQVYRSNLVPASRGSEVPLGRNLNEVDRVILPRREKRFHFKREMEQMKSMQAELDQLRREEMERKLQRQLEREELERARREYERSLIKTEEELALERNTVIIPDEESAHILNLRSNCITIEHGPKTYIIKEGEEQVLVWPKSRVQPQPDQRPDDSIDISNSSDSIWFDLSVQPVAQKRLDDDGALDNLKLIGTSNLMSVTYQFTSSQDDEGQYEDEEYRDGDEYEDDDYVVVMDEDEYKSISEYGSEHDYNYDDEDEWNADWDNVDDHEDWATSTSISDSSGWKPYKAPAQRNQPKPVQAKRERVAHPKDKPVEKATKPAKTSARWDMPTPAAQPITRHRNIEELDATKRQQLSKLEVVFKEGFITETEYERRKSQLFDD